MKTHATPKRDVQRDLKRKQGREALGRDPHLRAVNEVFLGLTAKRGSSEGHRDRFWGAPNERSSGLLYGHKPKVRSEHRQGRR